jgi:hypothetical protein
MPEPTLADKAIQIARSSTTKPCCGKFLPELWPGPDGWSGLDPQKPAAVVVRYVRKYQEPATNVAATGDAQLVLEYDSLTWLAEFKPVNRDTVEKWKELLLQAFSGAKTGCETGAHDGHIICAVRFKYMLFPGSYEPSVSAQGLHINIAGTNTHFPSQLRPVPDPSPHVPKLSITGDPDQYQIGLSKVWGIEPQ